MKISKVTITGADDSVRPEQLFELAEKYPFVEWGILLSRNQQGGPRFPSKKWLQELEQTDATWYEQEVAFSAHLCGAYVREFLVGDIDFAKGMGKLWDVFQRVQLNTHGIEHKFSPSELVRLVKEYWEKDFIFQFDNANVEILKELINAQLKVSTLFDLSHGAGTLPSEWPKPIVNVKCGYAGGLSPDNLKDQLWKIMQVVGDAEVWVDMETHVRSDNNKQFDLEKVDRALEISAAFRGEYTLS
jgi:hypothetical protein